MQQGMTRSSFQQVHGHGNKADGCVSFLGQRRWCLKEGSAASSASSQLGREDTLQVLPHGSSVLCALVPALIPGTIHIPGGGL